jgi:hypothetical protein
MEKSIQSNCCVDVAKLLTNLAIEICYGRNSWPILIAFPRWRN